MGVGDGVKPFVIWKEQGWLPAALPFGRSLPMKTLQEATGLRTPFGNFMKMVWGRFLFFHYVFWMCFLQARHHERNRGRSLCPDNRAGGAVGQGRGWFILCSMNALAQQFACDYPVEQMPFREEAEMFFGTEGREEQNAILNSGFSSHCWGASPGV